MKSPTFPFLSPHCDESIEEFITKINRRQCPTIPMTIHNLKSISNFPIHSPSDNQFRLPSQSSKLPQLLNIRNRHGENRIRILFRSRRSKCNTRHSGSSSNIYSPF